MRGIVDFEFLAIDVPIYVVTWLHLASEDIWS